MHISNVKKYFSCTVNRCQLDPGLNILYSTRPLKKKILVTFFGMKTQADLI